MGIEKLIVGQRFKLKAAEWNQIADTVGRVDDLNRVGAGAIEPIQSKTGIIKVKNISEIDFEARYPIVGIGDILVTDEDNETEFLRAQTYEAVEPKMPTEESLGHVFRFAICRQPLRKGAIGEAMIFGRSIVKIDFTNDAHECAKIVEDDVAMLESCAYGSIRVVWSPGMTGEQWALVDLDNGKPELVKATAAESEGTIDVRFIDSAADVFGPTINVKTIT